jgi:hypothetical protein
MLSSKNMYLHKVHTYIEYHSVRPLVGFGTSHPLSRQRVCPSPGTNGWGAHSPGSEGLGESQFRRLEKRLSTLPTLCVPVKGLCGRCLSESGDKYQSCWFF